MFGRIDFVRLGEHTFNSSKDCQVGIESNRTICSDPPVNITVQHVDVHPDFKEIPGHYKNDIGLIRLNEKVNYTGKSHFETANIAFQVHSIIIILLQPITSTKYLTILDYIRPICLPLMGDSKLRNKNDQAMMLAGWGFTDKNKSKFFGRLYYI